MPVPDLGATIPDEGPIIGAEMLRPCTGMPLLSLSFRPCRDLRHIRTPRAHSIRTPTPTPTPSAILLVVVKPTEEAELAEDSATVSVAEDEAEDTGVARLDVLIEVAVAAVAVDVAVVVGSVMLK